MPSLKETTKYIGRAGETPYKRIFMEILAKKHYINRDKQNSNEICRL